MPEIGVPEVSWYTHAIATYRSMCYGSICTSTAGPQIRVLLTRLNKSSCKEFQTITWGLKFSDAKYMVKSPV